MWVTLRHAIFSHMPRKLQIRHWVQHEIRTGERELRLVSTLLRSSGTLVDIGANAGIYSAIALDHRRWVVAFEPVPEEAARLRCLIGVRGVVYQIALSDHNGTATLHVPYHGERAVTTRSSLEEDVDPELCHRKLTVKIETLDSFELAQISLIKIDVEGHELAVLRGAVQTIIRCRPNLLIEVEESRVAGSLQAVSDFLSSMNYSGFWFDGKELKSISNFNPVRQQAVRPRFGEPRSEEYINNFIWLPS